MRKLQSDFGFTEVYKSEHCMRKKNVDYFNLKGKVN